MNQSQLLCECDICCASFMPHAAQNIAADALKIASLDLAPYSAFSLPIVKQRHIRVKLQTSHQNIDFKYFPPVCD